MRKLSVLMTVFNEADFIDYAIRGCLPFVDDLVIVEGSYLETQKLGQPARSDDGTCQIIEKYRNEPKVHIISANGQTDKDQRNVGLSKIKELNPDGWLLIIDGDEVYNPSSFTLIKKLTENLDRQNMKGAYFNSLTFVNDLNHYTNQQFPRLFKITPECTFINDNFMSWKNASWTEKFITKISYIQYYHYSFVKNRNRTELKKQWWETRFGTPFDYGWKYNEKGLLEDKNHTIFEFKGHHPEIMKGHPRWSEDKNG